jgi:hypothetical protein
MANLCNDNRNLPATKCIFAATPNCLTASFYDFKICWFNVYTGVKLGRCHCEGFRDQIGDEQQRAGENRFLSYIPHPVFLAPCLRQRDRGRHMATKRMEKYLQIFVGKPKRRFQMAALRVDGSILLKWVFKLAM